MEKRNFLVRRFRVSDINGVVKLFENVFEGNFSREWWNWKYELNPAGFWGEKGDIWIAEDANKEIVGYWAVMPEKLKLGSQNITVGQAVDAATHPDYRKLGIYKALVRNVLSDVQSRYEFIFSFPRRIPYESHLRHGWKGFRISEFIKFINYDQPLKAFFQKNFVAWSGKVSLKVYEFGKKLFSSPLVKTRTANSVKIYKVNEFPDEMDDFWKQVRSEYEICLERTATFLNWRFSKNFGDYQIFIARSIQNKNITGYLVLRKTRYLNVRNVLDIMDLHALPSENECLLNLIDTAITVAKTEGLDLVHCRVPPWHRYASILSKRGFIALDGVFRWLKIHQPRIAFYQLSKEGIIPKIQQWFYTLADTDYA